MQPSDPSAAVEVITSPPSVCQGDFEDDETYSVISGRTFRSSSSVKTFATGFSNCSNVSFNKLHRGFTPTSALHREMLAVLAGIPSHALQFNTVLIEVIVLQLFLKSLSNKEAKKLTRNTLLF